MNVLILMPKTALQEDEWYVFTTGTAYVSSALKRSNLCNVFTKNLNTSSNIQNTIWEEIDRNRIDIIATGGLSVQFHLIKDIITIAKSHKPDIITIVGGGYITSEPTISMVAIPQIDIGIIGEGEITICELVNALQTDSSLDDVEGIIFRDSRGILNQTKERKAIEDLDALPFPDYDGFDFESTLKYSPSSYGIYNNRSAVLITSRGCPFNCTFCFHPQGGVYRTRRLDNVFHELEWLIEKYKIENVLILDELFGGNETRLIEFCDRIANYNLKWWAETRVQFATKSNLQKMKDSGCVQILLGIENINNNILESMNKHTTVEEIERALRNAYDVELSATGVLLFGDPKETWETADNTIEWWLNHPEYNIILTTVQVYPGSLLWKYAIESGRLATEKEQVEYLAAGCPKLNVSKLSNEDFAELCMKIGTLNQSRSKSIIDATITNEKWEKNKLLCDVSGKCVRCNAFNVWPMVNLLSEGSQAECFICHKCGQSHTSSFNNLFFENAVNNLALLIKEHKKVALWGQGRRLAQIFETDSRVKDMDFFYVDNSPAKWGQRFFHLHINPPKSLIDYSAEVLIVAVGDANLALINSEIAALNQINNNRKIAETIYTLSDLMNPSFKLDDSGCTISDTQTMTKEDLCICK